MLENEILEVTVEEEVIEIDPEVEKNYEAYLAAKKKTEEIAMQTLNAESAPAEEKASEEAPEEEAAEEEAAEEEASEEEGEEEEEEEEEDEDDEEWELIVNSLQFIVTNLSQQADGHTIQSKIFESQGLKKLAQHYAEHAAEERKYVENCIVRLLDLGAEVKLEAKPELPVYTDAIKWIKYDLQVSADGTAWLLELLDEADDDVTTFDILKEYFQDEEEDLHWAEEQLTLCKLLGKKNWYLTQV